ncbi:MAG: HD domain-containing phosphohydrolase [Oscillospiraceae bacterium]|jgi:putative nucleotidyltransferase with HDIG domain
MRKNKRNTSRNEFSILALDDDSIMTATLKSHFEGVGYKVDVENDPYAAIDRVRKENYDILLLDYLMRPICGDQVVEEIRRFNIDIYIILLTGHKSMAPPIKTIRELDIQGYFEKSDRFDQLELLVESCVKSIRQMRIIRASYLEMTRAMRLMVDAKDIYTRGHSDRVSFYAYKLAVALGYKADFCERVRMAGLFHDIGKLGVPDEILLADRRLTPEEFESVKTHSQRGYDILSVMSLFKDIAPIIKSHHERWDGKGYPEGISGTEIPEAARIIALADAFDAMTSTRRYRRDLTFEEALDQLRGNRGTQFDPEMADVFIELIGDGSIFKDAEEYCRKLQQGESTDRQDLILQH